MIQPTEPAAPGERPLLTVAVGGQWLGLPLELVREVSELEQQLLPVPGSPSWLAGLLNHHGEVVPVLAADFWLDIPGPDAAHQLVLLEVAGDKYGLLVERVGAVETLRLGSGAAGQLCWYQDQALRLIDAEQFRRNLQQRLEEIGRAVDGASPLR